MQYSSVMQKLRFLDSGRTIDLYSQLYDQPGPEELKRMAQLIRRNGLIAQCIENADWEMNKKSKWAETDKVLTADGILELRGPTHVRDALFAIKLQRVFNDKFPNQPGQQLILQPKESLARAMALEKLCTDHRWAHGKIAYRAGFVFDQVWAWANANKTASAGFKLKFEESFKQAVQVGERVYEWGSQLKTFKYQKYALASGVLSQLGGLLLGVWNAGAEGSVPAYFKFIEESKKKKLTQDSEIFDLIERKTFKTTGFEVSSAAAAMTGFFLPIERSLFYIHRPYYLRKIHPDLYRLSVILSAANALLHTQSLSEFQLKRMKEIGVKV